MGPGMAGFCFRIWCKPWIKQPLVGLLAINIYLILFQIKCLRVKLYIYHYLSISVATPNQSARAFHSERTGQDLLCIQLLTWRCSLNSFRLSRYLYNDVKVQWDRINILAFVHLWAYCCYMLTAFVNIPNRNLTRCVCVAASPSRMML